MFPEKPFFYMLQGSVHSAKCYLHQDGLNHEVPTSKYLHQNLPIQKSLTGGGMGEISEGVIRRNRLPVLKFLSHGDGK